MKPPPVRHLDALDYARGIAILAVLLFHTLSTVYGYDTLPWNGWFRGFSVPASFLCLLPLSIANIGVPVFFVVSGFCIHLNFRSRGQSWATFFTRRIFRIYPAYLAALAFFILLYINHFQLDFCSPSVWKQLLTHTFLVHNYSTSTIGAVNGSFWSLAVEAQLYLLYPLLIFLTSKFGWQRTMFLVGGIEIVIRGAEGLTDALGYGGTTADNISWIFTSSPLGFWFSWSLGAFIAEAYLNAQPLPFAKARAGGWLALAIIAYFVHPLDPFRFLLFALISAIIISRLLSRASPAITAHSLPLNSLRKIGQWSYSLYLLHQPLLITYCSVIAWAFPSENLSHIVTVLLVMTSTLAVFPLGILWYHIFEVPGIALGKWLIRKVEPGDLPTFAAMPAAKFKTLLFRSIILPVSLLLLAAANYFVSVKFMAREPELGNNLAWSFATNPDSAKRNGPFAVKLAEDACQRTQYKQTVMVGTLAAAYAEAGRFHDAVSAALVACNLAEANGETNYLQRNRELLQLYESHQPYHEPAANSTLNHP